MKTDLIPTVIIKLQNGEQLIGEITEIPQLGAFRVFNPMSLFVDDELELYMHSFLIGSGSEECIIRKCDILTAVPASIPMIELYYETLGANKPEVELRADDEDDSDGSYDYLSRFGLK